ncbi:MAG: CRTAC1 family protein [Capsulimonadales bacterium]|nr:CRTAC1 family protein [Capsulimonadales bacterium]
MLSLLPFGCTPSPSPKATVSPAPSPTVVSGGLFANVTEKAGIRFRHDSGATGKFLYIENTPPGCAFFDYDEDGRTDLFLVQSGPSEPFEQVKERPRSALYRNRGDGTFAEVTAGSGLDRDLLHAQGVAVGDYDNDGYSDLLVSGYDRCFLFRNEKGSGRFRDVTASMGLASLRGYFTSAAFGDYDNDGRLDLYLCRYSPWTWKTNIPCKDSIGPEYCTPEVYEASDHVLLHNEGARFRDVSRAAGILKAKGRGLSVAFLDYDGDGRQDIFVANDITPNMLWRNRGDGTFVDVAVEAGCAYDSTGQVMAGMGIGVGDYDHSGRDSLFVGNFSGKPNMLYRNMGNGLFEEASYTAGVAIGHMPFLTFGAEFVDYDRDGWSDLLVVNGHVQAHADQRFEGTTYRERKQLFRNEGDGRFREIEEPAMLGALSNPTVGRGLAVGDFDNDGRPDALVANQNDAPELLRNESPDRHHWVSFLTVGTKSNREGRHARFVLTAGGVTQSGAVRAGSSYLSHSDRRVFFGLGEATKIDRVEVRWPSGTKDTLTNVPIDTGWIVTEGKGITGKLPGNTVLPK